MNENNYASSETCKKLVDAGIRLCTEEYFDATYLVMSPDFCVVSQSSTDAAKKPMLYEKKYKQIPRPSMAEIWRELPEGDDLLDLLICYYQERFDNRYTQREFALDILQILGNINNLCELLIWVKGRKE